MVGSCDRYMFYFLKNCQTFLVFVLVCYPPALEELFSFSTFFLTFSMVNLFQCSHSNRCTLDNGFILHFPDGWWLRASFPVFICCLFPVFIFVGVFFVHVFAHFKTEFSYQVLELIIYYGYKSFLSDTWFANTV